MADARAYYNDIVNMTKTFVTVLDQMETLKKRMESDPNLSKDVADAAKAAGRNDLAEIDFTNWSSALGQVLFAFNSGSPTQASYIYKVL